jgi:hypothetical protein
LAAAVVVGRRVDHSLSGDIMLAHKIVLGFCATLLLAQPVAAQSLLETLTKRVETMGGDTSGGGAASLSEGTVADGLREALTVGIDRVVGQLGSVGGFLDDSNVRIPLPGPLEQAQSALRMAGLSGMADDLEVRMNRAAEEAVPVGRDLFTDAIESLTFEDVMEIYNGPNDAATRYLEKTTSDDLATQMRPIVENALQDTGAVQVFDQLVGDASGLPFVGDLKTGLTDHVLTHANDGVFGYLAAEEKAIRENPAARTTELLETVFGN